MLTILIVLCLVLAGGWSVYALWDNEQIYAAASDTMVELQALKPVVDEEGEISFEEILEINSDVCAWVTLDGTNIDYPVVQGETNLSYLNTNVYGEFALSGSIFLDTRNSFDFADAYSLLYGHHMDKSLMFGDLDYFKEQDFIVENHTGEFLTPDEAFSLEVIACINVVASDDYIFDPTSWDSENIYELLDYAEECALSVYVEGLENARSDEDLQILALSTCDSGYTESRTVVLARMIP